MFSSPGRMGRFAPASPRRKKPPPPPPPPPPSVAEKEVHPPSPVSPPAESSDDNETASEEKEEEVEEHAPPPVSSMVDSSDDDDSEEEEEEDRAPSPVSPPLGLSDDDDDSTEEEKEEEQEHAPSPVSDLEECPDGGEEHEEEEEEEDDNGEENMEDEPEDTEPEGESLPQRTESIPAFVADPLPVEHDSLAVAAPGETSRRTRKRKIEVPWTETMKATLLEKMLNYSIRNGDCQITESNFADFRKSLVGCSLYELPDQQILDKVRDIEEKQDMEDNAELGELVSKICDGAAGEGSSRANRKKKKKKKKKASDDIEDQDGDATKRYPGIGCSKERLSLWEDTLLATAMEKFGWSIESTRRKIASMELSDRVSMSKNCIERRVALENAMIKYSRVERDQLKTIF